MSSVNYRPHSGGHVSDTWYDFADVAALTGHTNDALAYLKTAMQTGFKDTGGLRTDEELICAKTLASHNS